jgi:hypothetical protein
MEKKEGRIARLTKYSDFKSIFSGMNLRKGVATLSALFHMGLTILLANQWALILNLTGGPGGTVPTTPVVGVTFLSLVYAAVFTLFCVSLLPIYCQEPHLRPITLKNGIATGAILIHAVITAVFWNEWSFYWDLAMGPDTFLHISWFTGYLYLMVFLLALLSLVSIFYPKKERLKLV